MHSSQLSRFVLTAVGASVIALSLAGSAEARRSASSSDCTQTGSYWVHHIYSKHYDATWANVGENTPFFQSGRTYYQMLTDPTRQSPYNELALDYIPAVLNVYKGASMPNDVLVAFMDAEALFTVYAPSYDFVGDPDGVTAEFEELRTVLSLYNRGRIGPGSCPK